MVSAMEHVLRSKGYDPVKLNPWFYPSPEYYKSLLVKGGFKVELIELEPRLTPLNSTIGDWIRLFCRKSWFKDMSDEEAEAITQEVERICNADAKDEQGVSYIMYCRLRFHAVLI